MPSGDGTGASTVGPSASGVLSPVPRSRTNGTLGCVSPISTLEGAFRFHDLRHYAVSTLIAQRADIKLLQAIAGHASATVTLDTYGHLMVERVTEAASLYDPLDERLGRFRAVSE